MFSIVLTISHLQCVYDEKTSVCNFPNVKKIQKVIGYYFKQIWYFDRYVAIFFVGILNIFDNSKYNICSKQARCNIYNQIS